MKILFISNGIWEYDGRLRELVEVFREFGQTKLITRSNNNQPNTDHIKITNNNFIIFIIVSVYQALISGKVDILFIDNRKAIIPAIIIRIIKKPRFIILDVRELYLSNEVHHLKGKIGCYFESWMIKKASIVISANKQRSKIMKEYYKLSEAPLVYQNIRKIDFSESYYEKYYLNKYHDLFKRNTCKIISTSGFSISRTNDILVKSMTELGENYELLLVGGGRIEDRIVVEGLIKDNDLSNVTMIDMVEADELKFLIQNSDIGIVNYHQRDSNNKYCASGKIYEFLFEGIPVVTTENDPLKELCDTHQIGEANNNYSVGISNVSLRYEYYKKNVLNFMKKIDTAENNANLLEAISNKIEGSESEKK